MVWNILPIKMWYVNEKRNISSVIIHVLQERSTGTKLRQKITQSNQD